MTPTLKRAIYFSLAAIVCSCAPNCSPAPAPEDEPVPNDNLPQGRLISTSISDTFTTKTLELPVLVDAPPIFDTIIEKEIMPWIEELSTDELTFTVDYRKPNLSFARVDFSSPLAEDIDLSGVYKHHGAMFAVSNQAAGLFKRLEGRCDTLTYTYYNDPDEAPEIFDLSRKSNWGFTYYGNSYESSGINKSGWQNSGRVLSATVKYPYGKKAVELPAVRCISPLIESIIKDEVLPVVRHPKYKGAQSFELGLKGNRLWLKAIDFKDPVGNFDQDYTGIYNADDIKFAICGKIEGDVFVPIGNAVDTLEYRYTIDEDLIANYDPLRWTFHLFLLTYRSNPDNPHPKVR